MPPDTGVTENRYEQAAKKAWYVALTPEQQEQHRAKDRAWYAAKTTKPEAIMTV